MKIVINEDCKVKLCRRHLVAEQNKIWRDCGSEEKKSDYKSEKVETSAERKVRQVKSDKVMVVFLRRMKIHLNVKSGWRLLVKSCRY